MTAVLHKHYDMQYKLLNILAKVLFKTLILFLRYDSDKWQLKL
jgi:hypothetical protein